MVLPLCDFFASLPDNVSVTSSTSPYNPPVLGLQSVDQPLTLPFLIINFERPIDFSYFNILNLFAPFYNLAPIIMSDLNSPPHLAIPREALAGEGRSGCCGGV